MWFQESFFKYTSGIIMVLTIVLLLYYTAPVFYPILWFITAILLPILFSTFIYYILRPAIYFLERWGIPRYISVLLIYLIFLIGASIFFLTTGPKLLEEVTTITTIPPEKLESIKSSTNIWIEKLKFHLSPYVQIPAIENTLMSYLPRINAFISYLALNTISSLASIAIALALTPFVLFYFLRDDNLFSRFILRYTPAEFQDEVQKILSDIDTTLSDFILAQLSVAIVIGLFLLIGYLIIGLPHALPLALFAMVFYVIPILGTFIAIIPALIVAISTSLYLTLKVIIVMLCAHFIEANLVTPRLMSKRLKIHPLTIIFLLLAAGSLYGLIGLLLVTPTYAIIKVIVWNLYKISRLRYVIAKTKAQTETLDV